MSKKKINVAIVGLGFGAEFIPIHQRHPHVELVAICQRSADKLAQVGKQYGVERLMVNSSCDWGESDCLSIPRVILTVMAAAEKLDVKPIQAHLDAVKKAATHADVARLMARSARTQICVGT